ncbi:MAG TPA: ATP-binding protein [Candidatus Dojkabacteria bacterium]|nr:ATP-binding protein [Candidatus Dojkabacteria bacterium]
MAEDNKYQSKTIEELKEKESSLTENKFATFTQDLAKDLEQIQEKKNNENNQLNQKERYNDPVDEKKKEVKKNPILKFLDNFIPEEQKTKSQTATQQQPVESKVSETKYEGLTLQDIIAPIDIEVDFNHLQMGDYYFRTFFISGYPRFVGPNWLSPIINFEHSLRISTFYYPVDSKIIMEKLKKKIAEMEATIYTQMEERKVIDASLKVALSDAQQLQDSIAEGTEKFFHFAMYITIYAPNKDLLEKYSRNVVSTLAAIGVTAKPATLQQEPGFISTQPLGLDKLYVTRNMDTTSLATTFPFVTSELTMDHGIMYGINMHNKSLVIFDRFELENANSVVFAKSGAGKSYFVKLEALRSLMLGTDIIIIDPEREYEDLSRAVGGSYISFSQDKGDKMNPFELSGVYEEGEDELRIKIQSLIGFFKIMFDGLSNTEISILDRALILTYREKGITYDPATQKNPPPMLEDLYKVLKGMAEEEAHDMARRMERFIIGSGAGVFNEATNFEINNSFTVFSVRDLQEELKPLSMYLMLDFIWTVIRKEKKRRLLIVDEAWYMMQRKDSAEFMYSIAKRARKYYLGLTTITQDVADFMHNDLGKAIIQNASMSMLMMQSPSAVEAIQEVFHLSDGEKAFLLNCEKGQGLFFAGQNHVAMQVISSVQENTLITSDPRELERMRLMGEREKSIEELSAIFEPPATQMSVSTETPKNKDLIERAVGKRKEDIKEIKEEREKYQEELKKRLEEQDKQLNPDKYESQKSMGQLIEENTVPGQVMKERKEIQKGKMHITPQGVISDENEQQPKQQ